MTTPSQAPHRRPSTPRSRTPPTRRTGIPKHVIRDALRQHDTCVLSAVRTIHARGAGRGYIRPLQPRPGEGVRDQVLSQPRINRAGHDRPAAHVATCSVEVREVQALYIRYTPQQHDSLTSIRPDTPSAPRLTSRRWRGRTRWRLLRSRVRFGRRGVVSRCQHATRSGGIPDVS
jgi:hypothetical protein